jgi:hypothetical protein
MKSVITFALAFCFLVLALTTLVLAEEHYIYRNLAGKLVISNQPPPAGSNVLRKLELTDGKLHEESREPQPIGRPEDSPKPSNEK